MHRSRHRPSPCILWTSTLYTFLCRRLAVVIDAVLELLLETSTLCPLANVFRLHCLVELRLIDLRVCDADGRSFNLSALIDNLVLRLIHVCLSFTVSEEIRLLCLVAVALEVDILSQNILTCLS